MDLAGAISTAAQAHVAGEEETGAAFVYTSDDTTGPHEDPSMWLLDVQHPVTGWPDGPFSQEPSTPWR